MARTYNNDWERLASVARYDATELAALCQWTLRQLQRQFQRQFARTPQEWLNEQRLKAASARLLAGQPVKVVAAELGYKQASHFCRQFKAQHQLTPSEFVALAQAQAGCRPQITNVAGR